MSDRGLICSGATILVRMRKGGGCYPCLALDADRDRLVALLSVAFDEFISIERILPSIVAASDYWQGGDKALANLRLAFTKFPCIEDPANLHRLRLAETLLDEGFAPVSLMKALWPALSASGLSKYAPNQPRVPAGNGRRSGEWEFRGGVSVGPPSSIVLASGDKPQVPEENSSEFDEISGHHQPKYGATQAEAPDPLNGVPAGVPTKPAISLEISRDRFGEAASHMIDAQAAGKPSILTIDRSAANANRAVATGHLPTVPNKHLDEYPPAMFREGGRNASVRAINPSHNQALGGYIGRKLLNLPNGTKVELKVVQ